MARQRRQKREKRQKRGRRERRRGLHRLYAFVVILLGVAIIALSAFLLFYVQKIEVKGNAYTDESLILETVQSDKYSVNSLYLLVKFRYMEYELPGSLSSMKVSLKNPWTVKVTVKEKPIVGYVYEDENYVFFDKEGTVVRKSREMEEGAVYVEGAELDSAKLYRPLRLRKEEFLKPMLLAAWEAKNYELAPDKILCAADGIELYFGGIRALFGMSVTTEKMAQLTPILARLEGERGVLDLRYFENDSKVIPFTADPPEAPKEDAGEEDYGNDYGNDYSGDYGDEF